jgi:serine protease inhibitor ecotin
MTSTTMTWAYKKELQLGNIVIVDCNLQQLRETLGSKLLKAGFEIVGISFVYDGEDRQESS